MYSLVILFLRYGIPYGVVVVLKEVAVYRVRVDACQGQNTVIPEAGGVRWLLVRECGAQVLPNDAKARRLFVTSGGLSKVQEIDAEPGSTLMEYITIINSCFPEEIVRYYSPGYPDTLLEKVEQYSPQMMTILRETEVKTSEIQTDQTPTQDTSNNSQELNLVESQSYLF